VDESEIACWARAERARVALEKVADQLWPHGIRLAAFKGISIVFGEFGDPSKRALIDADALVVKGSFVEAVWRARRHGWPVRFDDPSAVMLWVDGSKVDLHARALPYPVGRAGRSDLEGALRPARWARSELAEFDDVTHAVLLLAHLAKDRFATTTKCSRDMEVLQQRGVRWPAVVARAESLALRRAVVAGLTACGYSCPATTAGEVIRAAEDVKLLKSALPVEAAFRHRLLADTICRGLGAATFAAVSRPLSKTLRHWI